MVHQPSFDPLAQPDMLAALTRPSHAATASSSGTPLGGWTSFDNDAFSERTRSVRFLPSCLVLAQQRGFLPPGLPAAVCVRTALLLGQLFCSCMT